MVLGHQVNKEMTNQEHSGLLTRLSMLARSQIGTYFSFKRPFKKERVFLAALATADVLEFRAFGLGWQDMYQTRMETEVILDQ